LTREFARADGPARGRILRQYLALSPWVNNWDLVDASAPTILGESLWGGDTSLLDRLARSPSLWERRMAIVATLCFIRRGRFVETLRIAGRLLRDREDLIHKATGWMLREVGKRDRALLERFLRRHRRELPRTTLRYAIERFPPALRRKFLAR
jgi:3-methyladenine DNA glycosylase AlkD